VETGELYSVEQSESYGGNTFEVLRINSFFAKVPAYPAQMDQKVSTYLASVDANYLQKFFERQIARLVHIKITNSAVRLEPAALYYMKGQLELSTTTGGKAGAALLRAAATGETLVQTVIKGTGEVFLEPYFGPHYLMINIEDDAVLCDKGAFYCSSQSLELKAERQGNIAAGLFGGEGLFQPKISGSGVVVLKSPVPIDELITYELAPKEKLSVDGTFAVARTGSVAFRVERSARGLLASAAGGEGLLQTFEGPGLVWLAPTERFYK
jgi:uncharacterized protein (AIM24 family)